MVYRPDQSSITTTTTIITTRIASLTTIFPLVLPQIIQ